MGISISKAIDSVNSKAINLVKTIHSFVVKWIDFYLTKSIIASVPLKFGCYPYRARWYNRSLHGAPGTALNTKEGRRTYKTSSACCYS